ncbi:MAG TPA: hypothetical protein VGD43_22725 [Micromonospora sp.]
MTILAIGPRDLPGSELVEVWFDTGSGWAGQRAMVPVKRLTLPEHDRGESVTALYEYESYHCRG